ncbi:sugar ABC transporter permease [Chania multitudinisentens RB-25]|uniref:Sugar ABC transporter permease n=1 Tax=Chania multitudinisentens RB-25 TaxID=1441930 RepID=W0LHM1_9GAMM|nr:sugar ABC transporter permease [Chania multitudinisentens RB-25]
MAVNIALGASAATAAEPTWIVQDPLTLQIHMHFRDKWVWNENWPVAQEVARLTNVKLVGTANKAATNSLEQFNLMLASNELPDIVGGDNLKDNFIRYGMEGAFIPLNELIAKHAPNLKTFFDAHPEIAKAITAPDGNLYFIPYVPDGATARGYFIRQDWLDKLGLKVPQTTEELYTVLKAFREMDPNGNGKKDETPFIDRHPEEVFRLVNFWGARASGSNNYLDFYVEDGKIKHPFAEEAFKTGMVGVAKWYKEGLIDPEIFTRKARSREQQFGGNVGGMTHDWFASTMTFNDTMSKNIPGFKLIPIAPPANTKGERWEEDTRQRVRPDGWAITVKNQHPIETIKLFDFYFSPQGRNIANFGVEGKTFEMKDGKPQFMDSVLKNEKPVNNQLYDIGAQIPIGYWMDYDYERQWTSPDALAGIDMYQKGNYHLPAFDGVNMTQEERQIYDKYWPELKTFMYESAQAWVIGTRDPQKDWDNYQKQLKQRGLDQVLAVMQKAYDRQYKS